MGEERSNFLDLRHIALQKTRFRRTLPSERFPGTKYVEDLRSELYFVPGLQES